MLRTGALHVKVEAVQRWDGQPEPPLNGDPPDNRLMKVFTSLAPRTTVSVRALQASNRSHPDARAGLLKTRVPNRSVGIGMYEAEWKTLHPIG